jgi:hypothetical protein
MQWHFLTVGLGEKNYERAAHRLTKEALLTDVFSSASCIDNSTLNSNHREFVSNHGEFLKSPANRIGYGNFLWKPFLMLDNLKKLSEGDGLCYLDAGCVLNINNLNSSRRMKEYLSLTERNGSLLTQLVNGQFNIADLAEKKWTHPEIFELLEIEKTHQESNQIQAGIIFLINNSKNREILQSWWETSILENYRYIKDKTFISDLGEEFQNRHDQSIFSCLAKKNGMFVIPDETYFYPNWKLAGANFPIWAMRNRNGLNPVQFEYRDALDHIRLFSMRVKRRIVN